MSADGKEAVEYLNQVAREKETFIVINTLWEAVAAYVAELEAKVGGNELYLALGGACIRRILDSDAKCDPPEDVLLRLEAILLERERLREKIKELEGGNDER